MTDTKDICGIIMPISHSDDLHTEAHWEQVLDALSEAAEWADLLPQPVWEGSAHDVIQTKIMQNIFENPIAICDLSTRNPNVMLEIGMRLTTKKPTVLVAEQGTPLPFDTGVIYTEFYPKSLKYGEMKGFVKKLTETLKDKINLERSGNYKPYLENFRFETVEPKAISITSEEHMAGMLAELSTKVDELVQDASARKLAADQFGLFVQRQNDLKTRTLSEIYDLPRMTEIAAQDAFEPTWFKLGDLVEHERFGVGEVVGASGRKVEVRFADGIVKRLPDSLIIPVD